MRRCYAASGARVRRSWSSGCPSWRAPTEPAMRPVPVPKTSRSAHPVMRARMPQCSPVRPRATPARHRPVAAVTEQATSNPEQAAPLPRTGAKPAPQSRATEAAVGSDLPSLSPAATVALETARLARATAAGGSRCASRTRPLRPFLPTGPTAFDSANSTRKSSFAVGHITCTTCPKIHALTAPTRRGSEPARSRRFSVPGARVGRLG
jgi:hypothetical protein